MGYTLQSGGAGLAVLANTAWQCDTKQMEVGREHAGERWTDILGQVTGEVVIDDTGSGLFSVGPRGVAVWVNMAANGRETVNSCVL